jgi:hypothetical protein
MRATAIDTTEIDAAMDRAWDDFLTETWPKAQADLGVRERQRAEGEQIEVQRRRRIQRRETVAFWTGIGGNVVPWVTTLAGWIAAAALL